AGPVGFQPPLRDLPREARPFPGTALVTPEQCELLAGVNKGTQMGELLRRFWFPAVLSRELEADGAPVRIKLLGEDLVAFRDSNGRVGLLREFCSHRGASLYFARNGDRGL